MINPYSQPLKSISSRYQLMNISGNTKTLTDVEFKNGEQGYIYAPYIMVQSTTIIEDGNWARILRQREIKLRKEKIQKLYDRIRGNI
jgi:hypothetical protein